MRWMSIRDINMLIKKGLYQLETGASHNLIYDRQSGKYVGHIDRGGSFVQDRNYEPNNYIIRMIHEEEKGGWNDNSSWGSLAPW